MGDNLNYLLDDYCGSNLDDSLFKPTELVGFPRQAKVIRVRSDHFEVWKDKEFLHRFHLTKNTVKFILDIIEIKLSTYRFVVYILLFVYY